MKLSPHHQISKIFFQSNLHLDFCICSFNHFTTQSLGFADISMTVVDTAHGRRPQLRYLRGSACPSDPHTELSAVIDFYCEPTARRGRPELREVHEQCQYRFDWPTNVVCPERAGGLHKTGCEVYSSETKQSFDLRQLGDGGKLAVSRIRL